MQPGFVNLLCPMCQSLQYKLAQAMACLAFEKCLSLHTSYSMCVKQCGIIEWSHKAITCMQKCSYITAKWRRA